MDNRSVPAKRRSLVLIDEHTAPIIGNRVGELERQGAIIKYIDYQNLMGESEGLRRILDEQRIDFVVFARNDQVFDKVSIGPLIRTLQVGYESFSGIDPEHVFEQTSKCLDDFLTQGCQLGLEKRPRLPSVRKPHDGTFSLIFDLEQLGGVRFGLPRVLDLLDRYDAPATFFVISYICQVYTDVVEILRDRGHEVGLHGRYHEYLAGHPLQQQMDMIRCMICDLESAGSISGANFVYRMDANTLRAMSANRLDYFVSFMVHSYRPFAYYKLPTHPMMFWTPEGVIQKMSVHVETNNRPWFTIKNAINSAVTAGRLEAYPHVNILLHPFRDGALHHIGDLERILDYLRNEVGYQPVRLMDMAAHVTRYAPTSFIYYTPQDFLVTDGTSDSSWRLRWRSAYYEERVSKLYQALAQSGEQPALCVHLPKKAKVFAVDPYLPDGYKPDQVIEQDPLMCSSEDFKSHGNDEASLMVYRPGKRNLVNLMNMSRPRYRDDFTGLLPEIGLRLAYRLSRGKHIF